MVECILVTHGDADHFVGLPEILESEKNVEFRKRLFMQPRRIYHNGIVKRPSKRDNRRVPEKDLLGPTTKVGKELFLVGLEENLLKVDDEEMNQPFKKWKDTLATYHERAKLELDASSLAITTLSISWPTKTSRLKCSGRSCARSTASRR